MSDLRDATTTARPEQAAVDARPAEAHATRPPPGRPVVDVLCTVLGLLAACS